MAALFLFQTRNLSRLARWKQAARSPLPRLLVIFSGLTSSVRREQSAWQARRRGEVRKNRFQGWITPINKRFYNPSLMFLSDLQELCTKHNKSVIKV